MQKLKRLGAIAVLAVCCGAIFQVGVASASSGFYADEYPAEMVGANSGSWELQSPGGKFQCTGSYSKEEQIKGTVESFTVLPGGTPKCVYDPSGWNIVAYVSTGGCGYSLHPQSKLGANTYSGTLSLGPAGCGPMKISFPEYFSHCVYSFSPQTAEGTVTFENSGGEVNASANASARLTASISGCGSGTASFGYHDSWKLASHAKSGSWIGLHATDKLPNGLFLSGEGAGSRLEAEAYPATYSGAAAKTTTVLNSGVGTFQCTEASYAGSESTASAEAHLVPTYGSCVAWVGPFKINVTAKINGCEYASTITGLPYTGEATLVCPVGQSLEFTGPGCSVTVPPQQLGTTAYENTGSGAQRGVKFTDSGSAVKYSSKGATCGTHSLEDGVFAATATLQGYK